MANSNTLTNAIPRIMAQTLLALRGFCVMPGLVNLDYGREAKEQGDTIDVTVPSAITAQAVSQSNTPPDDAGVTPTKVQISLSNWYEAPFFMSDKDIADVFRGIVPAQLTEAAKSIADKINDTIFAQYTGIYGYAGTAATTPFASDVTAATALRKVLNAQKAPLRDRRAVLNVDAAANALGLRAFQDASYRGDDQGIREGIIGRKLGFDFYEDQAVPSHTAGTAAGATTDAAGYALGIKTVTLASAGTGSILVGDVITFAGDTQTYVVTSGDASVAGGGSISFEPGLKVAITTAATAITLKATHVVNMGFHRDAFALAMRPLATPDGFTGGNIIRTMTDPQTGMTLRLEISRQHKRTRWSIDALWGTKLVRPELASRLAG